MGDEFHARSYRDTIANADKPGLAAEIAGVNAHPSLTLTPSFREAKTPPLKMRRGTISICRSQINPSRQLFPVTQNAAAFNCLWNDFMLAQEPKIKLLVLFHHEVEGKAVTARLRAAADIRLRRSAFCTSNAPAAAMASGSCEGTR